MQLSRASRLRYLWKAAASEASARVVCATTAMRASAAFRLGEHVKGVEQYHRQQPESGVEHPPLTLLHLKLYKAKSNTVI